MNTLALFLSASLIAGSLTTGVLAPTAAEASAISLKNDLSKEKKPSTIKVLLTKDREKILVEATGRYLVYDVVNDIQLVTSSVGKFELVTATEQGLEWGEFWPGVYHIRIVPGDSQSRLLLNGTEYKGCLEVYDVDGKLSVINEVDTERYLKATLSSQISEQLNEEVMEALAIAARTNLLYTIAHTPKRSSTHTPWDVDAKEVGYLGHAFTSQNRFVDRAINRTRHMILTYNNAPFPATWTKDSAGKTAPFSSIFRREEALAPDGVTTTLAAKEREARAWSFSLTKQEVAKALGLKQLSTFDLCQDKESQRVFAAQVADGALSRQIDFLPLQKALGSTRLKSNDFTIKQSGEQITFSGFGEGHGVGLCLYSASQMAKRGEKAPKILTTFFPEAKLENTRKGCN